MSTVIIMYWIMWLRNMMEERGSNDAVVDDDDEW